jgi:predicted PurR-regulated permease PerM
VITRLDYESIYSRISTPLQSLEQYFISYSLTSQEEGFIVESLRENIISVVQSATLQEILNELISFTGNVFVGLMAVAFITFILLYDHGIFRRQIIKLIPNKYFEVFIVVIYKIETLLSNYLIGILFQIVSIFCIAALGLTIVGVKYALAIAIFAAVANLIPYAGPLLGTIFGIAVGVSTGEFSFGGNALFFLILKIVSVFAIVQLVDNLLLQPLIFSKSVKAHPLEIFLVIFAGATIAGILGMIAAIPVYTVLRVIFGELYNGYKQYYVFKAK